MILIKLLQITLILPLAATILRPLKGSPIGWPPFTSPSSCYTYLSTTLPYIFLQSWSGSIHRNADSANHMIIFSNSKSFGLFDMGQTELENIALVRKREPSSAVIPTIHGTYFLALSVVIILTAIIITIITNHCHDQHLCYHCIWDGNSYPWGYCKFMFDQEILS